MIKYNRHIFTNLNEIVVDFEKSPSRDVKKMYKTLKPTIIKLQKYGIYELKDISMIFKECGFTTTNINQFIIFLLKSFQVTRFSNRDVKKFNKTYSNIILNSLFLEYPNQIIQMIGDFVSDSCPNIHNHDFLLLKIKQLISKNENEAKNQIITNEKNESINLLDIKKNKRKKKTSDCTINNEKKVFPQYMSLLEDNDNDDEYFDYNFDNLEITKI